MSPIIDGSWQSRKKIRKNAKKKKKNFTEKFILKIKIKNQLCEWKAKSHKMQLAEKPSKIY